MFYYELSQDITDFLIEVLNEAITTVILIFCGFFMIFIFKSSSHMEQTFRFILQQEQIFKFFLHHPFRCKNTSNLPLPLWGGPSSLAAHTQDSAMPPINTSGKCSVHLSTAPPPPTSIVTLLSLLHIWETELGQRIVEHLSTQKLREFLNNNCFSSPFDCMRS